MRLRLVIFNWEAGRGARLLTEVAETKRFGNKDNQLVQFMATPGELVTVTPAGKAGGDVITRNNSIDASGADADRILALLPAVMEQTSDQTVARIQDLNARGRF